MEKAAFDLRIIKSRQLLELYEGFPGRWGELKGETAIIAEEIFALEAGAKLFPTTAEKVWSIVSRWRVVMAKMRAQAH
jgi:hypothetical protein